MCDHTFFYRRTNCHSMKVICCMFTTKMRIQNGGELSAEIRKDSYLSLMVRSTVENLFLSSITFIWFLFFLILVEEQTQEIELPLHDAARRGNLHFLKEYLKQGISGTGLDAAGNTPLYWAARTGHLECARELLNLSNSAVNAQVIENREKKYLFILENFVKIYLYLLCCT